MLFIGLMLLASDPAAQAGCDPARARCLWVEPRVPNGGEMVMFETTAEPWAKSAVISAFGQDIRMFRVGDRFRAYGAVPLKPMASAPVKLWLNEGVYRCLNTPVTARGPIRGAIPQESGWVKPRDL